MKVVQATDDVYELEAGHAWAFHEKIIPPHQWTTVELTIMFEKF